MTDPTPVSERVRVVALPVAFFLGIFGAHRFYVGKIGTGLLMAATLGGGGLWWLYDLILILAGEFRDSDGRRLTRWTSSDPFPELSGGAGRPEALLAEVDGLRAEMGELAERVDFMERLLTQARERGAIPPR